MGIFKKRKKLPAEPERPPVFAAIIAAGGQGSRMGPDHDGKQLINLCGAPVIARAISAFQRADSVRDIVVAAREEDIIFISDVVKEFDFNKVTVIIRGGPTRQASVAIGLGQLAADVDYITVHDGARPLVRPEQIDQVARAAARYGAAALGAYSTDTIKRVDKEGFIVDTIPREFIVQIQTPQAFRLGEYREALARCAADGVQLTDDCQLMERVGRRVMVVPGDSGNIKITVPQDVHIARALLGGMDDEL